MKKSKMFTKTISLMVATMLTVCMTGCGSNESNKNANNQNTNAVTTTNNETTSTTVSNNYSDTITLVWYPNESAEGYSSSREEVGRIIAEATGKKVEQKLTTDYAIAIESVSSGSAQIGCCWGAEGYIQAKNSNDAVNVLFTNSGESGTLDDAMYYSFLAVNEADVAQYEDGNSYSITNIAGKKMSFVSNSSTSGFKVPTNSIISFFSKDSKWAALTVDDLIEGGKDSFFSEVLFGGSHQGSAFNLLSGKAEVAAFCDIELAPYATYVSGEEKQVGCVYEISKGAEAPFNTVEGSKYMVIASTPVMNGPFVYNADSISPEDVAAIQAAFTSDEAANNHLLFYPADSEDKEGLYKKSGDNRFLTVEDSWYDPIRNMK